MYRSLRSIGINECSETDKGVTSVTTTAALGPAQYQPAMRLENLLLLSRLKLTHTSQKVTEHSLVGTSLISNV